jgi:hypothetical protein
MEVDDVGTPKPRDTELRKALRAIDVAIFARFCKYVVLLCGVSLTLMVVFDAYSFYVARRDIDSELRSKKVSSLENLNLAAERQRALAITTLEGRCLERTQLTLFRIFDAEHDRIKTVYNELMEKKNQMIDTIKKLGPGLIDVDKAADYIDGTEFTLAGLDDHLKPLNEEAGKSANYHKLKDEITITREEYVAVAKENTSLRHDLEQLTKDKQLDSPKYWNMNAIKIVVERIDQLRKELSRNKGKFGDLEDVMARYAVWTGALTGGAADNPLQDDVAYVIEKADAIPLKEQNCNRFKDYYAAVNQRILAEDPVQGKSWGELAWTDSFLGIRSSYRHYLQRYFNQPPAAQTMFVTMFLGALGALTLNMLRMSKVGWWSRQDDPLWGEIIVGPLLGSLAAFGIFLIGSSGLLLTADTNGAQPLSAYFIGLLGFVSGLLYDEAFGRVRRVGTQMFAAKPDAEAANARAEDRSLAETLRGSSASLAAGLVLKYGIGTRVSLESEFTLLIPSDEAMGRLTLTTWTMLNDPKVDIFEKWYHRHHAAKRITKADVAGDGTAATVSELRVDDGTSYVLALDGGDFKFNNVRVLIADVIWNKGVIHILSAELP